MPRLLRRRDFLKEIGSLGFLCIAPNTLDELLLYKPAVNNHKVATNIGLVTCFVGTGSLGRELGIALSKTTNIDMAIDKNYLKIRNNFTSLYDSKVALSSHLKNMDWIFLFGAVDDQDFWLTRELIISNKPCLLMTFVNKPPGSKFIEKHVLPEKKECWINLPSIGFKETAQTIICDIYNSLAFYGPIGVDFQDLQLVVSGEIGKCLFLQTTISNHMSKFKDFVYQNMKSVERATGAYIVFSYKYQTDFVIANIEKMAGIISSSMCDDANIFYVANSFSNIVTGFRVTILLA